MYNKETSKLEKNLKKIYKLTKKNKLNLPQARQNGLSSILKQFEKDLSKSIQKEQKKMIKQMKENYFKSFKEQTGANRNPQKQATNKGNYPWSGMNYEQRLIKNAQELNYHIKKAVNDGFKGGGTYQDVLSNIQKVLDKYQERHEQLVRTENRHMYLEGKLDGMKKNGVLEVQYLTAGDNRVCKECESLEGFNNGVYKIDEAPLLPRHPRCRCEWYEIDEKIN